MLQGPVARARGDMCRGRWQVSGGGKLEQIDGDGDCWPDHVEADFNDVEVGIALTVPEMADQEPLPHIEALYVDLIARAKRWFYAARHYFASRTVAEALATPPAAPARPAFLLTPP